MTQDAWLTEAYFDWLRREAFQYDAEFKRHQGALRVLHDIPFYWMPDFWADENRAGDAMNFRQYEFLHFQQDLDHIDQVWLGQWATATPTVLEVLLGMARRWSFYFGGEAYLYFGHFFINLELQKFPGRAISSESQHVIRERIDNWLTRQMLPNGQLTPLCVTGANVDMRRLDIWGQMNAYSLIHFQ